MKLVESFLTKNPCYNTDRKITVKGIMLTTVGCPQPSAKVFLNNWNRKSYTRACPHAIVDATSDTVYQTLPWEHRGWHSNESANNTMIGVTMCEPNQIRYQGGSAFEVVGDKEKAVEIVKRTYKSAVEICAKLCEEFNLDPLTDIYSTPPMSDGLPGKNNPVHLWDQMGLPYDMGYFRKKVKNWITPAKVEEPIIGIDLAKGPDYSVVDGEPLVNNTIWNEEAETPKVATTEYRVEKPYIEVQIDVPNLRIRKGPGTGDGCEPTGEYTGAGRFQISEIQNGSGNKNGWGKLFDGRGWISMDFVKIIE